MRIKRTQVMGALLGTILFASGAVAGCGPTTQPASSALQTHPTPATALGVQPTGGVVVAAPATASGALGAPVMARAAPEMATTPETTLAHGITVTGSGRIQAQPDEAFVSTGVQTRAQTAQDAQATNNRQMQAVVDAVKALGIPAKDIQSSGVSLYPVYGQNQTLEGYEARNNVSITVEQVGQAGQVLDAAVKAGANLSSGIGFGLKNDSDLRNKALSAAVTDARAKANTLAAAAGVTITGVQAISESSVSVPVPVARAPMAASAVSQAAVPVEPGELTITAQVTVVYGF